LSLTPAWPQSAGPVRLNEIQIIGSHNSYHSGLAPSDMELLRRTNPKGADSLDYRHPGLDVQLGDGVRQLELDVYGDTKGGLFAHPAYPGLVVKAGLPADPPYDLDGVMLKPGFKVLHVQDVDYRSNCEPFTQCLAVIRTWSKAHPGHLPLFILVENKDGKPRSGYMTTPEPLTPETFDALDAEIRSVFPPAETIVPDDVRGQHETLEEAVLTTGWPTLDRCRGKVIFLLDQRRVGPMYLQGHPSLKGRVLFTNSTPGTPDAAFVEMNNPETGQIPELVRKGYLIRTMTDPGPQGVRDGSTGRRDAAIASGAQILSTDYPYVERAPGSNYSVSFDNGNVRCNPVLKPKGCDASSLRDDRPR
jgi:hypothetical protein